MKIYFKYSFLRQVNLLKIFTSYQIVLVYGNYSLEVYGAHKYVSQRRNKRHNILYIVKSFES